MKIPPPSLLITALAALLLGSCASTTHRQPSPGMAIFDATPDPERRDRIDGIRVAAVNDRPARGTELELSPGLNKVRVGFKWPQGGRQEVDLPFEAKPDKTYLVYYDVFPPYVNRMNQPGFLDGTTGELAHAAAHMDVAAVLMFYPIVAVGTGAVAARVGNTIAEESKTAEYVDVMVVARHSSQGIACNRRVYPDGRVEKR